MTETIKIDKKNVKMIAHRGVSGIEIENTVDAFVLAGKKSYFGIETDVHVTKDGKFVVHHDDNLLRVWGVDKNICDCEFDFVRKICLNKNGKQYVVPTLEEYLEVCNKYKKVAILEFKNEFSTENLVKVVKIVENCGMSENIVYISFASKNIENMRKLFPNSKLQFLTCNIDDDVVSFCNRFGAGIDVEFSALNENTIKLLKQNKIEINCWTVNEKADGENLVKLGVNYITSNILE